MRKKPLPTKQELCVSCRKCCEMVGVYIDPDIYEASERELAQFYRARGFEVSKEDGYLYMTLDIPCPHLSLKGCTIYKKRPKLCREYSGIEDFGKECLWSMFEKKKASPRQKKK